jgi:hypothetical protein
MTSPAQTSAIAWFRSLLSSWGIAELVPDAQKLIMQGLGADAVTLSLEQTAAYKQRFAANEIRRKKGLAVLSPAEYVATAPAYAQAGRQFGLPAGFYDSRDDFTRLIGADVSPQEFADRARSAQELVLTGPAENRAAWRDFYGLSDGAAIAAILDPGRAMPLLEKQLQAARIGGAARAQGLGVDRTRAEYLAASGVTDAQARAGYGEIALGLPTEQAIAQRFGETIGQSEVEAATFGVAGAAEAEEKRRRLKASEAGLFAGRPGADTSSLSRSTVGSY